MADVKIIDIDGEQWNIKDQEARNKVTAIEESINNIQTLLSNTDIFKLNIRKRRATLEKELYSPWSMGKESIPNGYDKLIMLPFVQCPLDFPVIAINAVSAVNFDNVYIYNPTLNTGDVVINLISIFKKR